MHLMACSDLGTLQIGRIFLRISASITHLRIRVYFTQKSFLKIRIFEFNWSIELNLRSAVSGVRPSYDRLRSAVSVVRPSYDRLRSAVSGVRPSYDWLRSAVSGVFVFFRESGSHVEFVHRYQRICKPNFVKQKIDLVVLLQITLGNRRKP